jgi:indole-3-glycerol phosphate synthase
MQTHSINIADTLSNIVAYKRIEVANLIETVPVKKLEQSVHFGAPTVSLAQYITRADKFGIIAEIKRKSPSEGNINAHINVEELSIGYMQAGASALSILTDEPSFGGTSKDLAIAREFNFCPILRKDFIIHEYQVVEAKSIGADAILLIGAILSPEEILKFYSLARSLGLQVLYEIYSDNDLTKLKSSGLLESAKVSEGLLIGVNNRNLKDFTVDISHSVDLFKALPAEIIKIAESGITSPEDMLRLRAAGYQGFLIGTLFMRTSNPALACSNFIQKVRALL